MNQKKTNTGNKGVPKEHLTNESVLVDWLFILSLGNFSPHLPSVSVARNIVSEHFKLLL